jgi:hypothetical protein
VDRPTPAAVAIRSLADRPGCGDVVHDARILHPSAGFVLVEVSLL